MRIKSHIVSISFLMMFFQSGVICSPTKSENHLPKSRDQFAFANDLRGSTVTASIDLNGQWEFKATDEDRWLKAQVPSTVWSDLMRVGRLDIDPFYRDNELKVQWVEKKEWDYRKTFMVDAAFLRHDKIILDCRGLDTIAEIFLNGTLIAQTQNMFIEYEFDVEHLLKEGANEIHIIFHSILEWNKQQVASDPRVTKDFISVKGNVFFARKEGADFGWNWGVRLLTCGIWRSIRLAAYDVGRILDLGVQQDLSKSQTAILNISTEIENYSSRSLILKLDVALDGKKVAGTTAKMISDQVKNQLKIKNPQLWWPNGWGKQPLYTVTANLYDGNVIVHQKSIRIGLRTVELVRERDEHGEKFGFKVNGHLIFCKGANWVPADALPDRLTNTHYQHLLSSCVESNMNMIRLWGGGHYEADILYDFCDENGLMIWHDFMFAVGPFLDVPSYFENVRQEISNVVRRLRHHPSIVLWCGNNEQDDNMIKLGGYLEKYPVVSWQNYDRLFAELIPQTAALYDADRPYWPCSPHHPLDRERKTPDWEKSSGDAHVWDVWHGGYPISWFEENSDFRFVSEYGFAAYPTLKTIYSFTAPEDRYFGSYVMEHHHKEYGSGTQDFGDVRIARQMARLFGLAQGFENFVYVSQVMQGEAMKIASEAFRRNYPETRGALYWQIDENWPNTCKSGMDYYGRWKAMQYLTRHFFNPILVTGRVVERTKVKIWGVNDRLENVSGELTWCLFRLDGNAVKQSEQPVNLPANSSTLITELDFTDIVGENPEYRTYRKESYENRRHYLLTYQLVKDDCILSSNFEIFVPYKYLALQNPGLKYSVDNKNNDLTINITSANIALFVELGLKNSYARFLDNYFLLLPGETRNIQIKESEVSIQEFVNQFYVKSLVDAF
jgi:beta-mannosidase